MMNAQHNGCEIGDDFFYVCRECSKKMVGLHEKSGEGGNLSMVKRKYSLEKYGFVALLKPVPPPEPITTICE